MKVLIVASGKTGTIGDVVRNQVESLRLEGIEIDCYAIRPGLSGYLSSISKVRKKYKKGKYDLAHAHYSFSGFVAAMAGCNPLVVSLMGSDVYMFGLFGLIARFFYKFFWDVTIVKTEKMKQMLHMNYARVIPNGVDMARFQPFNKAIAIDKIAYSSEKKMILFVSKPDRYEKNIDLAYEVVKLLDDRVELKHIWNIPNEEMPFWYNAADLLLLTSKWEGSVNVVKEALACNCPVVSTDVGDVKLLISSVDNCYISSYEADDIAEKIRRVLDNKEQTCISGRKRILELKLDSVSVARNIINIYNEFLKKEDKSIFE